MAKILGSFIYVREETSGSCIEDGKMLIYCFKLLDLGDLGGGEDNWCIR